MKVPSHAVVRNLLLEDELGRIVDAFERASIELVVLKGIPLAMRLFGAIDSRAMVDNDLLVRRGDAHRALEALRELGYESIDCRTLESQLDVDYQYRMARKLPASGSVLAELHWNAFVEDLYPVSEAMLWEHSEPFELGARRLRVFDRPMTVVHLAAHFAQSDFAIRSILDDLARAWNLWYASAAETESVVALARRTGLVHVLDFALMAAADLGLLDGEPPNIGSRRARRLRRLLPANRLATPRPEHDYARKLAMAVLAEPARLPRWLLRGMFPPLENLAAISGRPPSRALYVSYLTRPLRFAARAIGQVSWNARHGR